MSSLLKRLREAWHTWRTHEFGYAFPRGSTIMSRPTIPLSEVMELYERDPTCKSTVDLLTRAVITDYYTTTEEEYEAAKDVVDNFSADLNLDAILLSAGTYFIACGNDFWLKRPPNNNFQELVHIPITAIDPNVKMQFLDAENGFKIPYKPTHFQLISNFGKAKIKPEALIHFKINTIENAAFGTGLLQVLIHRLTVYGFTRPAYIEMKAKIEKIMPKIFEKYAGPDVLAVLEKAKPATIKKFAAEIRKRPEEGAWLFYSGPSADIKPVQLDPRARFEAYIDHIINQFYLGLETPLPRLFSTPGFTEASSKAALDLQDMLVRPLQRYVKRLVEREIFWPVLRHAGYDPLKAKVRLNWGTPETPEIQIADLLEAAKPDVGLIRPEEFRKNAVKFGWELWEPKTQTEGEESEL